MSPGPSTSGWSSAPLTGRYDLFLGVGGGLAVLGLILFVAALGGRRRATAPGSSSTSTGCTSPASRAAASRSSAVQKITNAKWSGLVIRFAEASVAFLPVSLLGLVLIFTRGVRRRSTAPWQQQLHALQHGKAVWLSHEFMFGRLFVGLAVLYWLGWTLIRADLVPDMFVARGRGRPRAPRAVRALDRGITTAPTPRARAARRRSTGWRRIYVGAVRDRVHAWSRSTGSWRSSRTGSRNLLGGWYFMGSFLGAHMLLALMMHLRRGAARHRATWSRPSSGTTSASCCFGFTVFWTYLMWAQFLVIWYGNLPEETGFVFSRLWGQWRPIGRGGADRHVHHPVLRTARRRAEEDAGHARVLRDDQPGGALARAVPAGACRRSRAQPGPPFGLPRPAPTLLFVGLFLLCYALFARTFPMVSPRLAEITLDRERGHAVVAGGVRARGEPDGLRVAGADRAAGEAARVGRDGRSA